MQEDPSEQSFKEMDPGSTIKECIEGDVRKYRTKQVWLCIRGKTFECRIELVPQLKCLVLLD